LLKSIGRYKKERKTSKKKKKKKQIRKEEGGEMGRKINECRFIIILLIVHILVS